MACMTSYSRNSRLSMNQVPLQQGCAKASCPAVPQSQQSRSVTVGCFCTLAQFAVYIILIKLSSMIQKGASKLQGCAESVIKLSKTMQQGPSIPDFLRVPLSEAEHKGLLYRDMLQGTASSGTHHDSELQHPV